MTSTLFIIQIVLAILITILVLLQKSSSMGLGAYSGSNESLFGAKGPAGFLTKATFALALLFVINTLALGYLYSKENKKSAVDTIEKIVPKPEPKPFIPKAPLTTAQKSKDEVNKSGAKESKVLDTNGTKKSTKEQEINASKKEDINNSSKTDATKLTQKSDSNKSKATLTSATQEPKVSSSSEENKSKGVQNTQEINKSKESNSSSLKTSGKNDTNNAAVAETKTSSEKNTTTKEANSSKTTLNNETNSSNLDSKPPTLTKEADNTNSTQEDNTTPSTITQEKRVEIESGIKEILKTKSIKFATDSSFLEGDSINTIKEIANFLKKYPHIKIEIGGHTDNTGNEENNKKLSQERVNSVKKALIEFGVDPNNLKAVGYGSSKPLVDNSTQENRAKNRRVEFRVIE